MKDIESFFCLIIAFAVILTISLAMSRRYASRKRKREAIEPEPSKPNMTNNLTSKYLVFDTETTNVIKNMHAHPSCGPAYPHIVQLAWKIQDESGWMVRNHIVKPDGFVIPDESVEFHGITQEIAESMGSPMKEILEEFRKDVESVDYLVAHNAEFDARMVASECYRYGIPDFLLGKTMYCTMKSTTQICKLPGQYGYKYPQLKELYFHLFRKQPTGKLHDASVDIEVTDKCWRKLQRRHPDLSWVLSYQRPKVKIPHRVKTGGSKVPRGTHQLKTGGLKVGLKPPRKKFRAVKTQKKVK